MPSRQTDSLLILDSDNRLAEAIAASTQATGWTLRLEPEEAGLEVLRELVATGKEPAVVLLGPALERPLACARQAHQRAPLAQLVFVSAEARSRELRRELARAPMIGDSWTLVGDRPDEILAALGEAVRSSRQRRQLRTTLDRLNMRLAEAPPADSERYRRLVISDHFLASILASAQDAILSVDARGSVLSWNRGAEALFGLAEREAAGLALSSLATADAAGALEEALEVAWRERVVRRELRLQRRSGSAFDAELTLAPVRDETGRPVAVSLIVRDVSERADAQRALAALNTALEARVEERTAQLLEANKELETFAHTVSHDLRTPLGGISGFAQALQEDYGSVLDATAHYYLARIQHNTERMGLLIDDIMALSKVSRQPLRRERLELCALAREIIDELRQSAPRRRVRFSCPAVCPAEGDSALLHLVLENLLGNAWKYSRGKKEARIVLGSHDEGGVMVYFVRDNGVGFDMAHAEKIFEAFQRLHSETDYGGTGVGLATVQRIIDRHGGRIWAEAEVGKGATFYFTLQESSPQ